MYADDIQLYASQKPSNIDSLVLTMSECVKWSNEMDENKQTKNEWRKNRGDIM